MFIQNMICCWRKYFRNISENIFWNCHDESSLKILFEIVMMNHHDDHPTGYLQKTVGRKALSSVWKSFSFLFSILFIFYFYFYLVYLQKTVGRKVLSSVWKSFSFLSLSSSFAVTFVENLRNICVHVTANIDNQLV